LKYLKFLEKRSQTFIVAFGCLQILVLGLINYFTGFELSFSFFYLIPVATVAWFGGKKTGLAVAFISAVVWQFANYQAGQTFSHAFVPIWNAGTRLGFFLVVANLLIQLKKSLLHEQNLARTDYLTGAANPRSFYETARGELERARRYGRDLSITYFDADNFKQINDTLGHQVGSDLLIKVVQVIKSNLRLNDTIARVGGDEFAILFPETNSEQARAVVCKIREKLNAAMAEENWSVTFSMGVLTCVDIPKSVDEMIKIADGLMYEVKKNGKNSVLFDVFEKKQSENEKDQINLAYAEAGLN
jgi:diguanylate cyclase (GGDEF)-like protein